MLQKLINWFPEMDKVAGGKSGPVATPQGASEFPCFPKWMLIFNLVLIDHMPLLYKRYRIYMP